jgi:hypothetical protein
MGFDYSVSQSLCYGAVIAVIMEVDDEHFDKECKRALRDLHSQCTMQAPSLLSLCSQAVVGAFQCLSMIVLCEHASVLLDAVS